MTGRDDKGRFKKGEYKGGPGRPKKEREQEYQDILVETVTPQDWKEIIQKTVQMAKKGDTAARKFLADYLIGTPPQHTQNLNVDMTKLTDRQLERLVNGDDLLVVLADRSGG